MNYLGYLAVILIQLSYIPQVYYSFTSGTKGLSTYFLVSLWVGLALLQIYSYSIGDYVYIVSNWIGLINTSTLLVIVGLDKWIDRSEEVWHNESPNTFK